MMTTVKILMIMNKGEDNYDNDDNYEDDDVNR